MEAPEGTEARKRPSVVVTSTSTVGFPRESSISRAWTVLIVEDIERLVLVMVGERGGEWGVVKEVVLPIRRNVRRALDDNHVMRNVVVRKEE